MNYEYDILSISPILSLYFLDSTLIPSVFFKFSDINNDFTGGSGADITLRISNILNLYFGISTLNYINSYGTDIYELGANINFNKLYADIRLYRQEKDYPVYIPVFNLPFTSLVQTSGKLNGVSANLTFDFWKIGFEGKFNYNSFDESQTSAYSKIKMHINGGIFYKDILFNDNLNLKTGFVLKYYDFESQDFESAYQLDFTVAGIIQKAAIVYFSWENLFDEQYFIVPYYPMRERGIRFGIAWELFN
jgi:outer membrane cobalamin receptor